MTISSFPKETKQFEIQTYQKPKDINRIRETHVPYSGSPRKHPFDSGRVILVADAYCTHAYYFEFKIADISFVEDLPNLVNLDGEVITMVRIWVKKSSVAIQCLPFIVSNICLGAAERNG